MLSSASKHRIRPLLYWHLGSLSTEYVPANVAQQLQRYFQRNSFHNLFLTGKLLKLLRSFEEHGLTAVPFKGPVLAAAVYGNVALREFGDLDLLVHMRDVARARELLVSSGYQPQYRLTRAQELAFLRYEREYTCVHDATGDVVELHWKVAPAPFFFSLETHRLWEHLDQVSLSGSTVSTFSPEDLHLFLCVHSAAHLWAQLGLVCDVAELIRVYANIDWARLMSRASVSGSEHMLLLGLFLANDLLQAPLPETISNKVRANARVEELARSMRERFFLASEGSHQVFEEEAHFHPFHLRVIER